MSEITGQLYPIITGHPCGQGCRHVQFTDEIASLQSQLSDAKREIAARETLIEQQNKRADFLLREIADARATAIEADAASARLKGCVDSYKRQLASVREHEQGREAKYAWLRSEAIVRGAFEYGTKIDDAYDAFCSRSLTTAPAEGGRG